MADHQRLGVVQRLELEQRRAAPGARRRHRRGAASGLRRRRARPRRAGAAVRRGWPPAPAARPASCGQPTCARQAVDAPRACCEGACGTGQVEHHVAHLPPFVVLRHAGAARPPTAPRSGRGPATARRPAACAGRRAVNQRRRGDRAGRCGSAARWPSQQRAHAVELLAHQVAGRVDVRPVRRAPAAAADGAWRAGPARAPTGIAARQARNVRRVDLRTWRAPLAMACPQSSTFAPGPPIARKAVPASPSSGAPHPGSGPASQRHHRVQAAEGERVRQRRLTPAAAAPRWARHRDRTRDRARGS